MIIVKEKRMGDTNQRAGIVVTNGSLLLCSQPTNMLKNGWKLDLAGKGHIQQGETPLQAAIRETYEETNILFESWKLTNPIQITYKNAPLYLFLAKINELIPTAVLSCASTFIDADGFKKPEVEGYRWISPFTELYLVQEELRQGIMYYFNKFKEDCQIAGGMLGSVPVNVNKVLSLGYKPEKKEKEEVLYSG